MDFTGCREDGSFGPAVRGSCRGGFDFTLRFEIIFLSLLPAAVFVAASLPRLVFLWQQPVLVRGNSLLRAAKLAVLVAMAGMQAGLLGLSAARPHTFRALFTSAAALSLAVSICALALSTLEHARSPRPSMLLTGYFFLAVLFDVAQARTLWLAGSGSNGETTYCRLFSAALAGKTVLLVLESTHKRALLAVGSGWDAKHHSPEEMSGLFGLGAFAWLHTLFRDGFRKVLHPDDLFALDTNLVAERLHAQLAAHGGLADQDENHNTYDFSQKRFGLARALAKTFAVPLLMPVGPRVAYAGFQFCQPFLINAAISYLEAVADADDDQDDMGPPASHGYGLIGAAVLVYGGTAVAEALYWYFQERVVVMVRGALASAVYRKTTAMQAGSDDDTAAVTLMSTDVERVRVGLLQVHEFWANLAQVALASYLLQRQIGAGFAVPLVVAILSAVVAILCSSLTRRRQKDWMSVIQRRVGTTASAIGHMKHLKISGLVAPVERIVQALRIEELHVGSRFRFLQCVMLIVSYAPTLLSPVITFALTTRSLDASAVFTALSYMMLIAVPLVVVIQGVPSFVAALACLDRVQAFLEAKPRTDFRDGDSREKEQQPQPTASSAKSDTDIAIAGSFGWASDVLGLRDIQVSIPTGKLTLVIGPVAAGKSTLCKALLGETPTHHGRLWVNHLFSANIHGHTRRIGFCDQTPYLRNASLRENILGLDGVVTGRPLDEERYREVVEAAMLLPDFAQLPQGDRTCVGSNGITLSGGQKQRVAIARALYADTDLCVFDDVLSGLDADTEEHVFRRVFGRGGIGSSPGLLARRGTTAVLCTHAVRHLPAADHVVALSVEGAVVEQGDFRSLLANRSYVHSLGVSEGKTEKTEKKETEDKTELPGKEDASVETHLQPLTAAVSTAPPETTADDTQRLLGDATVYRYYASMLGWVTISTFLVIGIICGFFENWGTIWLTFWVQDAESTTGQHRHGNAYYIGLYGLFEALVLITLFVASILCCTVMIHMSGSRLHAAALRTVVHAPLRFFTRTDMGVVTNYFSQDMTLIDGELPISLLNLYLTFCEILGNAAVIATSSPWLCLTYPFLVAVLYCIQKFYLRTSRQLRLLDLEAKSPLYTHFLDTISGLATFRAFGWVPAGITLNSQLVDRSQQPAYLLAMIQRWLHFVLQLVVAVLAIVVVTLATQLRSSAGFTGASLISLMSFSQYLAVLIGAYTMLETSIGAVSRIKTLTQTVQPESQKDSVDDKVVPLVSWPSQGEIRLVNVSATYADEDDVDYDSARPVLDHLTLTIRSGEKVAICGRTGSGKSSFILLLLRLLDPLPGTDDAAITIDGVPLAHIDRVALRERVIAVSQDAVFLPDGTTFQENLDPFGAADTAAEAAGYASGESMVRAVLEVVGLWSVVEARGGLAAGLAADALSQGQRQLFSLARAILRKRVRAVAPGSNSGGSDDGSGGLLLLDEVSSSVDQDTDRAMQQVIGDEFADYTVVMVSHRLDVVMDTCDTVVVLDQGRVAETGRPQTLVETPGSRFGELWRVGENH